MGRGVKVFSALLLALATLPSAAYAQAAVVGVVRDTSGAVLPGVTVEASSPVLIEKVRSGVTDSTGQFRILDLRPGVYTVTFTLPGFSIIKRDAIELTGSFTATVNAEMKVGAVEETITVTGETPIVDLQSATRERVFSKDVIDAIPTGRYFQNLAVLVPGVTVGSDVGGSAGDAFASAVAHGTRPNDQRVTVAGGTVTSGNGIATGMTPNVSNAAEITIDTGAVDATKAEGGVRVNIIPRDGGNTFAGSVFATGDNEHLQSDNLTSALKNRGAQSGTRIKKVYDLSASLGGPIKRDRVWFFGSWRRNVVERWVANTWFNANLGKPFPQWTTYAPDFSHPFNNRSVLTYASLRLTTQLTPRNKLSVSYDLQERCNCYAAGPGLNGVASPESGDTNIFNPFHPMTVSWTSPVTRRLLLDASATYVVAIRRLRASQFLPDLKAPLIIEQAPRQFYPQFYNGPSNFLATQPFPSSNSRFNVSYVTGSHAVQAGTTINWGKDDPTSLEHPLVYTLTSGVPTAITVDGRPFTVRNRVWPEVGIYAQDKWTRNRLTLAGGLRFDYFNGYAPEQVIGPSKYTPNRNITFPRTSLLKWKDFSPKMAGVFDLFGNGRTALKASLNRYLSLQGAGGPGNPSGQLVNTAARSWTDANNNFVPDCDLLNPNLQDLRASGGDLCGAFTGPAVNFGRTVPGATVDPDTTFGWHKRPYNWEFSAGVQQALTPRASVDVSYFRRWYGNFTITDNRAVTAADYDPFSIAAPTDAQLQDGSGRTISGLININPAKASIPTDNYVTFASNYGRQIEHWNGVDVNLVARPGAGILFQGGTSTGRTSTDNCDVLAKVPEASIGAANALSTLGAAGTIPFCHIDTNWLTQAKALGSYLIPRIDVQIAGTFQSMPGPLLWATLVVPNAVAAQSLGRNLSGNAQNIAVNVVPPGKVYGDRLNQVDLRFAKILKLSTKRTTVSVDLYNAFNGNAVITESTSYSSYRVPTAVLFPRIVKFTAQFDF